MGVFREISKNKYLYSMAIPGLLFLIIFAYIPMFGHLIAFEDFKVAKGLWGSPWVGFKNFEFFFLGQDWIRVTLNTIYLNAMFLVFGLGIAVVLSICLNEIKNAIAKKLSQTIVLLPYFISWLVVSLMTFILFNSTSGLINNMMDSVHMAKVSWYNEPQYWPYILTIISVWKTAGYSSIIFLAAITGFSGDYYESARIDGATRIQQIRYITIPLLRPTVIILALLGIGRIFYGDFGMIYGIIGDNGVLTQTTDVIDTYSFRMMRQLGNFSMTSAIVLYQSIMGLLTIVIFNWIIRRIDRESSLF